MDLSDAKHLSHALSTLMRDAHLTLEENRKTPELVARVTGHLGCDLKHVVSVTETFAAWEQANLQRGVDAYLARHSPQAEWFGVAGQGREHDDYVNMLAARRAATSSTRSARSTTPRRPSAPTRPWRSSRSGWSSPARPADPPW
nr:hypothetical protein GCM10020093_001090 [Planobispora longispora]